MKDRSSKRLATDSGELAAPQEYIPADESADAQPTPVDTPRELGGPSGPEPTRFGDWERKGRCIDF